MYSTYCYQHQTHGVVKSHKIQFRLILQDTFNTTSKHKPSEFQCPEYQRHVRLSTIPKETFFVCSRRTSINQTVCEMFYVNEQIHFHGSLDRRQYLTNGRREVVGLACKPIISYYGIRCRKGTIG